MEIDHILSSAYIAVPVALLIVAFLVAINAWRNEKGDAEYLYESLRNMRAAALRQLGEVYQELEVAGKARDFWRTILNSVEQALDEERRQNDEAGEIMLRAADYIEELEANLEEAEDDLEEADELINEAAEGWAAAVALTARTIALFDRAADLDVQDPIKEGW